VERGWGIKILEDARHCSVLYLCKYFVIPPISNCALYSVKRASIKTN
jgi:hypothetical protein